MIKKCFAFILTLFLCLQSMACVKAQTVYPDDVLSQKAMPKDKTSLTVLVKYAFSINAFEKAVEEKFPDINIIQVGNYTGDMGIEEYTARMKNDDLTDIVMTWPLEVGKEYWSDRLLDLSGLSATSRYNTKALDDIARGQKGKLYYIPGPSQIRGIIYNKTMFAENGWQVPKDFSGFVQLCKSIEAKGIRALQLGLENSEVFDTAFTGFGFESSYASPKSINALAEYNAGKGSFGDNFTPALNTFETLIKENILQKEDLEISYADREYMLFRRQCAMIEDSVLMARMGGDIAGSTDEFALMPFFNPDGENNDWARLYPVCYIGLNKNLSQKQNRKKYDAAIKLINYISTVEGQNALMGDTGAMLSALKTASPPDTPETVDLLNALSNGRYGVFPTLANAQGALREGLADLLKGEKTIDQVIDFVDAANLNPPIVSPPLSIGDASENFTTLQTGSFVCDHMRKETGSDFALFLDNGKDGLYNGKGISGKLYKGEITVKDIERILPDTKQGERTEIWVAQMTGQNLLDALEYALPVYQSKDNWFYYFSGLKMSFSPASPLGQRVKSITDEYGKAIDKSKIYSVAVMDYSVDSKYMLSFKDTNILIADVLFDAISRKTISPSRDNRFIILN